MSSPVPTALPSTRQLLKATALAAGVAGLLLVTAVLPAEYGIDPTGIGARLGLRALAEPAPAALPSPAKPGAELATLQRPARDARNALLARNAETAFGPEEGQVFNADAVSLSSGAIRRDVMTVRLEPGKGAEVKARLDAVQGMVFHWKATGDVALDMHGERPGAKNAWTSYAVEAAVNTGAGTFVAPFDGTHGWYWHNRGAAPVDVTVTVTGQQPSLYRP